MQSENIITNNDNDNNNQKYYIEPKLLYKIKFRCCADESAELKDYRHQNLKLSFDFNNYTISQYININLDLGLLELYEKYTKNFHTILNNFKSKYKFNNQNKSLKPGDVLINNQPPDFYRTTEYLDNQEEIYYLEEQIKNLIISLCYIKINNYIKKNYNTENYFIYNFNLDIKFIDDLCKYIYFNHYIDVNDYTLNHSNILCLGYFMNPNRTYHLIKKIAYITINGDIYYKK